MPYRPLHIILPLLAALLRSAASAQPAPPPAFDTTRGTLLLDHRAPYSALPLTVECRVKLDSRQSYNIIVANETKASATHWELFTMPGSGLLSVYTPGRRPDHCHSNTDIADGRWHDLAVVMGRERVRICVDGTLKADQATTPPATLGLEGPLAVGALVTEELHCVGQIAYLRLSAREEPSPAPGTTAVGATTVGLWRFDAPGADRYPDLSALSNPAVMKANTSTLYTAYGTIAGGMPTALQTLPPGEDPAPLRAALARAVAELGLRSVRTAEVRDAVLQAWSRDYTWLGKVQYPESRPSGADPAAIAAQVFDRHALVWDTDRGPLGTVLRRTAALLARLRELGAGEQLVGAAADLDRLAERVRQGYPGDDRPYYLAACAVRRRLALANPLLNFDRLLCAAHGSFAGSVRSNPATQDYQGGHFVTQHFGFNSLPGGGLYAVEALKTMPRLRNLLADSIVQNGRLKGQKLDHGSFTSPDLSYDGKQVVFAWTGSREHRWTYSKNTCWHLFRVNVDGSELRQLTDGPYNDFEPCWLPDGRLAFVSERRGGYIRCFAAYLKVRNYTLFSIDADGGDLRPLSYYETSEFSPSVNNEGQLVYTRWDYTDRENCLGSRLWLSGPDGTDPRAPHGNYPLPWHTFPDHTAWQRRGEREIDSRIGTPLVEMGLRAVPGSHRYLCTAAPHHGEIFGTLCLLDLRQPDDGHMSQVRRLTPEEPFPETELPNRRHYRFGTPWPLSEDFYLCNEWEDLVLLDRYGNKELLCESRLLGPQTDERLRLIYPVPLRPRPAPPLVAAKTARPGEPGHAPATISVANVYDSDQPFPAGTKIRWLRVVQAILKENHTMGEPMIGYERENTPRVPLGVVPVEEDGSAYLEAPVAKGLIFQPLDEQYRAVQSMRSTAFVHPGEQLSCVGCHQPYDQAPRMRRTPQALRRAPSVLTPELGPLEPISYYRQVKPIIDRTCLPCHQQQGRGPRDLSYEALKEDAFWFSGAMWTDMTGPYSGIHGGSRSIPGRFGARACRLGKALFDPLHLKAVSDRDRHTLTVWLDCNSLRLGAYTEEEAQLRGELIWPTLDLDPLNLAGVETRGRQLRGNFWHENQYGPYAFLASEHQHDRVVIMDAAGGIRWEYPIAHPQDAWLLPNGNVLTTSVHAVREVTPDKRTVWEYTTQAPNEIPCCQPLPDGRVLIGIVGECRLLEVDRAGKVVHELKLTTPVREPHAQFRMCRKTPEGTYLVPFTAEGAVREYDAQGKLLRSFPPLPSPVCALRLADGHTLISAGGLVTEYNRNGDVVWQLTPNDIPDVNIATFAGLQRLRNGNTIVCNWNTRDEGEREGAHILEVTPDKRIVWQVTGTTLGQVAQCQVLTEGLTPSVQVVAR